MKLFSDNEPFFRSNFHAHTTASDGKKTPEEVMAMYRDAGYDILSITDHRKVTLPYNIPEGLLLLPGIEFDHVNHGQTAHILGLGISKSICSVWSEQHTPQQAVQAIHDCGGVAVLAHPAWSLNTPEFIASLDGIAATEIWNSVSTLPFNGDRADSSSLIDVTAASQGRLLAVMGNDDAHFYREDFAAGWTMVQAAEKTVPAVLQSLRAGRFYASRGPLIHQIEVTKQEVRINCSPASAVVFYSARPWSGQRIVHGNGLTEAVYPIHPSDQFIRVQIIDDHGMSAWSGQFQV